MSTHAPQQQSRSWGRWTAEDEASDAVTTEFAPTTTTRAVPAGSFGAGTYAVGESIRPGTYTTTGADSCYWARLKEADGELGSIIANGLPTGPSTMVVKATDAYVEFSGDCTWARK